MTLSNHFLWNFWAKAVISVLGILDLQNIRMFEGVLNRLNDFRMVWTCDIIIFVKPALVLLTKNCSFTVYGDNPIVNKSWHFLQVAVDWRNFGLIVVIKCSLNRKLFFLWHVWHNSIQILQKCLTMVTRISIQKIVKFTWCKLKFMIHVDIRSLCPFINIYAEISLYNGIGWEFRYIWALQQLMGSGGIFNVSHIYVCKLTLYNLHRKNIINAFSINKCATL